MEKKIAWRTLLLGWLFCFCSLCSWAEIRQVFLYQTTDLHGTEQGARVAAILKRECDRVGRDKVLLIDTGDTVQGSVMATLSRGESGLLPLEIAGYDAWIPGNHEADFGVDRMAWFFRRMERMLLCANLQISGEKPPRGWRLWEKNGVRIAVIGLAPVYFRHWLLPAAFSRLRCETGEESLKRILPEIAREKPDVIVLAAHQSWSEGPDRRGANELHEIADFYPEIDLFLGAHSHRVFPGRKIGLRGWYVQPAAHGGSVAKVSLSVDTELHRVVAVSSELLPVTADVAEELSVQAAWKVWRDEEKKYLDRPTGIILSHGVESRGRPGRSNLMSELLARAIAEASGAEIAFHGTLSKASLPAGPLPRKMLHAVVPYENTIVVARLTAGELSAIMTEQWGQRTTSRYQGPWNAWFRLGKSLTFLGTASGKAVGEEHRYLVAWNSHAAAGSGTSPVLRYILEKPECQLHDTGISTRDALEAYLKKHPIPGKATNFLLK